MTTWTVYKHLAADETVAYVGCTNNLERRTTEHRKHRSLTAAETVVVAAEFAYRNEALACESALIQLYKPLKNKRGMYSGNIQRGGDLIQALVDLHEHHHVSIHMGFGSSSAGDRWSA